MNFQLRENFEGNKFRDLYELANRATSYERLIKEREQRKGASRVTSYRDQPTIAMISEDSDSDSGEEINVAEFIVFHPKECPALRKPNPLKEKKKGKTNSQLAKEYSFDITKADEIFDWLYKEGQIKLPKDHVIPPIEDRAGQEYCKYHHSWKHSTHNCVVFRNMVNKKGYH